MNIIKNSSVALTIGLLELTGRARAMQEFSFRVFEAFTAATVIYLITNLVVVLLMRVLENKVRVPGFIAGGGAASHGRALIDVCRLRFRRHPALAAATSSGRA